MSNKEFGGSMPDGFKPLLAAKTDDSLVKAITAHFAAGGVLWYSHKIDGIRTTAGGGSPWSRKGILIPNTAVQAAFKALELHGEDGELILGTDPAAEGLYNATNSAVMTRNHDHKIHVSYCVFDMVTNPTQPFSQRCQDIRTRTIDLEGIRMDVLRVVQKPIYNMDQLNEAEADSLEQGFEGGMIRKGNVGLKFGRSTAKELILGKLKREDDVEAVVIDILPAMKNNNEATTDALGHTKRSSHQENKVAHDRAGVFVVQFGDKVTNCAPGAFTHPELKHILANKDTFIGQTLKMKCFTHGMKDVPRFMRAIGWRNPIDL